MQGADKINKFKSLEGERHKHAAQRTQAPNATTKRYHKTLPLMGATRLASGHFSAASSRGIFQQLTDFITFCAIEWRILKVNELRCKNGYHWVAQAKSEPCFALLRAIRPCAAYCGRHKYISYISNIRLAPWFLHKLRQGCPPCL